MLSRIETLARRLAYPTFCVVLRSYSVSRMDDTNKVGNFTPTDEDTGITPPPKAKKPRRTSSAAAGEDTDGGAGAIPRRRSSVAPSPFSGPAEFTTGEYVPAPDWAAYTASIPPRDTGKTKIVSYNVDGLRAATTGDRKNALQQWVDKENPDILCLQEIKIDEDAVAPFKTLFPGLPHCVFNVYTLLEAGEFTEEGRYICAEFDAFYVINVYVPNSGMQLDRLSARTEVWDIALRKQIQALQLHKPVALVGDLNVAFWDMDLHSPKTNRNKTPGFCDAEREGFSKLLEADVGLVDTFRKQFPTLQQFSFWSARFNCRTNNKGWRLDYVLTSRSLADKEYNAFVRSNFPGVGHVPVGIEMTV